MITVASAASLIAIVMPMGADATVRGDRTKTVTIERGELKVVFHDNSESPHPKLSGVQSLFNVKHSPGFDAYDPDAPGLSAGLNFEHIISGHESVHNKFTPRHGRYELFAMPDGRSVQLVRRPEDSPWKMASTMTYTVTEPHYIDMAFECTPTDASLFGRRGYALFFWADYMNQVRDVALNFRGIDSPGGREKWIRADAPKNDHEHWNGGGTYRHVDARPLEYDEDVAFNLNTWSYDWPRFTEPFYYGRAEHDMVFILMFDRTSSEIDQVRFSLFKFKVRDDIRKPAWDWQYVINNVETGRTYGYRVRAVWKKFVSEEDCLREYETWVKEIARAPARMAPTR